MSEWAMVQQITHPVVVWLVKDDDGVAEVPDLDEHDEVRVVEPLVGDVERWVVGRAAVEERRLVHHHRHVTRRHAQEGRR